MEGAANSYGKQFEKVMLKCDLLAQRDILLVFFCFWKYTAFFRPHFVYLRIQNSHHLWKKMREQKQQTRCILLRCDVQCVEPDKY